MRVCVRGRGTNADRHNKVEIGFPNKATAAAAHNTSATIRKERERVGYRLSWTV